MRHLDEITSGLQSGEVIVVAGCPSQGKTAFVINLAAHAALVQKKAVAVFSVDLDKRSIFLNLLCSESMGGRDKLRSGSLGAEKYQDLAETAKRRINADLYVDASKGLTMRKVCSKSIRLAKKLYSEGKKLSLVIIDYLQLMEHGMTQEGCTRISQSLQALARDLDLSIVVVSQLPVLKPIGRPSRLSDLSRLGSLAVDASQVIFVHQPESPKVRYSKDIVSLDLHVFKSQKPEAVIPMRL